MDKHEHHRLISQVLSSLNHDLLKQSNCYFGGGTAITFQLNEFRLSTDIDLLCSDPEGYRRLRQLVEPYSVTGLQALFNTNIPQLREVRSDRYGIRSVLDVQGSPIKFEIVREDRIQLDPSNEAICGLPTLSRVDAIAEKMLANSDRWGDKSVYSRDLIDLAMMVKHWGNIPSAAIGKVRKAYGTSPERDIRQAATNFLNNGGYRQECYDALRVDQNARQDLSLVVSWLSNERCFETDYRRVEQQAGPSDGP